MKNYGFGIIGCGMIADFHAKAIGELPNAHVAAVSSRKEANARRVAEACDCAWHTDYKELLRREDVDIVTICSPSGSWLASVTAPKNSWHSVYPELWTHE